MKLKCRPEDFRVEEIADAECAGGAFALYRLTKTALGTPEAVDAICREWRIPRDDVGFGGLKDRHAVTRQYLSIKHGPKRNLTQANLELDYLGQRPQPFDSKEILANRFEVVLRALRPADVENIVAALQIAARDGTPNYFDDQRFGSVGVSGEFVARAWCLGDFERALWLAIAEPNEHDRPPVQEEKRSLREHWKNWPACRRDVVEPATRDAIERLLHGPHDFRGAFVCIPQHDRRMYLGAFQSFLWNRVLAERLRASFSAAELFDVALAKSRLPFYRVEPSPSVREELARDLPFPSSREKLEPGPLKDIYERVAAEFGLECRTLRVKYPRDSFFSRGSRAAVFHPGASSSKPGDDELYPGTRKLVLRFELPRGSYATVLIKRIAESM